MLFHGTREDVEEHELVLGFFYQLQICLGLEECKFVMLVWHES